jgi:hypothetical protein
MTVLMPGAPEARSNRWGADYFRDVQVVTQDAKTLHFYELPAEVRKAEMHLDAMNHRAMDPDDTHPAANTDP